MRFLFALSCLVALGLALAVLVAPRLDGGAETPAEGVEQLLALFARDAVARRLSLAGSIALTATAFVFLRPSRRRRTYARFPRFSRSSRSSRRSQPPQTMAGA